MSQPKLLEDIDSLDERFEEECDRKMCPAEFGNGDVVKTAHIRMMEDNNNTNMEFDLTICSHQTTGNCLSRHIMCDDILQSRTIYSLLNRIYEIWVSKVTSDSWTWLLKFLILLEIKRIIIHTNNLYISPLDLFKKLSTWKTVSFNLEVNATDDRVEEIVLLEKLFLKELILPGFSFDLNYLIIFPNIVKLDIQNVNGYSFYPLLKLIHLRDLSLSYNAENIVEFLSFFDKFSIQNRLEALAIHMVGNYFNFYKMSDKRISVDEGNSLVDDGNFEFFQNDIENKISQCVCKMTRLIKLELSHFIGLTEIGCSLLNLREFRLKGLVDRMDMELILDFLRHAEKLIKLEVNFSNGLDQLFYDRAFKIRRVNNSGETLAIETESQNIYCTDEQKDYVIVYGKFYFDRTVLKLILMEHLYFFQIRMMNKIIRE